MDDIDIALIEFINAHDPGHPLREIAERTLSDRRRRRLAGFYENEEALDNLGKADRKHIFERNGFKH